MIKRIFFSFRKSSDNFVAGTTSEIQKAWWRAPLSTTSLRKASSSSNSSSSDKEAKMESSVENKEAANSTPNISSEDNPLSGFADFSISSDSESDSDSKPKEKPLTGYALLLKKNEDNVKWWKTISNNGKNTKQVPYPKPKIIRSRNLVDTTSVFECNAWDDVKWDDEMKKQAEETVTSHLQSKVDSEKKEKLETEAFKYWDDFYGNHKNKFFRDRNWLFSEFPELESPYGSSVDPQEALEGTKRLRENETYPGENSNFKVLEVGCGVGNTVFPLLSSNNNPHTYVYCCDFSPQAVDLVRQESEFNPQRCTPFVLDITDENPVTPFAPGSLDVITAIFVVSAISPEKFSQVVKNFSRFLKPGGLVLFRDYGRYDLAQLRFKAGRCINDNFYMRGDGTRVYFFTEEEVEKLFAEEGFEKTSLIVDRRLQVNRGKQIKMYRVWVQGKFRKMKSD